MKAAPTRTKALLEKVRALNDGKSPPEKGTFPGVTCDSREQCPYIFGPTIAMRVGTLRAGDMSPIGAEDRCAIDRKALDDFCRCVTWEKARFERELEILASYDFGAIVVEATLADVFAQKYRAQVVPAVILGAAASITVKYGVAVFFTGDRKVSTDFTLRLLRSFWRYQMTGSEVLA